MEMKPRSISRRELILVEFIAVPINFSRRELIDLDMANTYSQIHLQFVFAVKYRQCLIGDDWKKELYSYISGIIEKQGHKMLAINGMPDHIHIFAGMRPNQSVSDLLQ